MNFSEHGEMWQSQSKTLSFKTCTLTLLSRVPTANFDTRYQLLRSTLGCSSEVTEKPEPEIDFGIT